MIISCIGHASFLIELDCGLRMVTDPYDDTCGYPVLHTRADVALISDVVTSQTDYDLSQVRVIEVKAQ